MSNVRCVGEPKTSSIDFIFASIHLLKEPVEIIPICLDHLPHVCTSNIGPRKEKRLSPIPSPGMGPEPPRPAENSTTKTFGGQRCQRSVSLVAPNVFLRP